MIVGFFSYFGFDSEWAIDNEMFLMFLSLLNIYFIFSVYNIILKGPSVSRFNNINDIRNVWHVVGDP